MTKRHLVEMEVLLLSYCLFCSVDFSMGNRECECIFRNHKFKNTYMKSCSSDVLFCMIYWWVVGHSGVYGNRSRIGDCGQLKSGSKWTDRGHMDLKYIAVDSDTVVHRDKIYCFIVSFNSLYILLFLSWKRVNM